ncbi:MAG: TerD family protein [Dehalococcoidia bacterium]|nr:TerD family protein [Dehalococcoidia bacterium]
MLTLALEKPGETTPKLRLSLSKGERFHVTVGWRCGHTHIHDVDVHALEARNAGAGAKVSRLESILSTYNTKLMNPQGGVLVNNSDGSFATPEGAVTHSPDVREQGSEETITIDGSRLPEGVNEIPIFVTIHSNGEAETFDEIEQAGITIADDAGKELGAYQLSSEFKEFNVVQFGSIILGEQGWEYAPVGRGFVGTFNDVLAQFS